MIEIERSELRCPATVIDIDIRDCQGSEPVDVERYATAWCLVRDGGVVDRRGSSISSRTPPLTRVAVREHVDRVRAARTRPRNLGAGRLPDGGHPDEPPRPASGGTGQSAGTIRSGLRGVDHRQLPRTARYADRSPRYGDLELHACHEPVPGISRARNRGIEHIGTDLRCLDRR